MLYSVSFVPVLVLLVVSQVFSIFLAVFPPLLLIDRQQLLCLCSFCLKQFY